MNRTSTWAAAVLAASITGLALLALTATDAQIKKRKIEVTKGVFISYPENWSPSAVRYRNAYELITPPHRPGAVVVQARTLITTEPRRDHAEALRRLVDVAKELDEPPGFRVIGGWPALERRYMAPLPRPGGPMEDEKLSLRVTTAIAAGDLLLRLETTLAPDAPIQLAEEAEAIGRSATFPSRGKPEEIEKEIQMLRQRARPSSRPVSPPETKSSSIGRAPSNPARPDTAPGAPVAVQSGLGELEIAVSNNGQNVVMAANPGYSFSTDGGATFTAVAGGTPAPFPRDGDPSLAFGASGAFYYGFIAFPDGSAAANNVQGCSTGISVSPDNGQTFQFRNHAVLCPQTGAGICFPDQEHIAADSINTAPGGDDQVYSVWRNFVPNIGPGVTCNPSTVASWLSVTASIVCSQDGGNNWTAPAVIGTGDFPRITVGPNGSVFVVYRSGNNVMLNRYSSCSAGLTQQAGFPVTIASVTNVACPVPGLDRCNAGNNLSSPMVAVDDGNPNHVFVAYATNTAANNENIVVRDSTDGGANWPRVVTVNAPTAARRFMPWVCSLGGRAYVSWYDRRAATAANNDLTDYYLGSAFVQGGSLVAGPEVNLSVNADPQCASGWPSAPRAVGDSESCSVQPQLAGVCSLSGVPCDFSVGGCPTPGETCNTGGGAPKYGDYNGNACASNRVYTAWASATSPPGLPAATGIRIFSSTVPTAQLTVKKKVLPFGDPGIFNLQIDGVTRAANVGNGGTTGAQIVSTDVHTVGETPGTGTDLADYITIIGGDCAPDGSITLGLAENKTCTITNIAKSGQAACEAICRSLRDGCFSDEFLLPSLCVQMFRACAEGCAQLPEQPQLTVNKVVLPAGDPGRFNLQIDGVTRAANVGAGGSTGPQAVSVGVHTVGETAGTDTDLADYTTVIGGACAPDGSIILAGGDNRTCTITNTGPRLTVNKVVLPAGDPGRFNLQIDGVTRKANVGAGGTTGPQIVSAGVHTVGETAGTGTNLFDYTTVIGGACAPDGSITLAGGDNKTCTITNTAKSGKAACVAICNSLHDACLSDEFLPPSLCFQIRNACLEGCPP